MSPRLRKYLFLSKMQYLGERAVISKYDWSEFGLKKVNWKKQIHQNTSLKTALLSYLDAPCISLPRQTFLLFRSLVEKTQTILKVLLAYSADLAFVLKSTATAYARCAWIVITELGSLISINLLKRKAFGNMNPFFMSTTSDSQRRIFDSFALT